MWYFFLFWLSLVNSSTVDCLERLVSKMTYYVSSGMLNPTDSPTIVRVWHWPWQSNVFLNSWLDG